MATSHQDLLEQWIAGRDAHAFRRIVSSYSGMAYATAKRILGNASDAEDLVQDCFETLARIERAPRTPLGPWLHRVATNRALDRLRTQRRRISRERRFADRQPTTAEPAWDDIYSFIDEAILELPEKLRLPVVSHYLEDKPQSAIAEELGVSRQTVTYRVAKGIEGLRRSLRRRGAMVGSSVLAAMLTQNAAEAAPAALTADLGRLTLAVACDATGKGGAGWLASLSGAHLKGFIVGLILLTAGTVTWIAAIAERSAEESAREPDRFAARTEPFAGEATSQDAEVPPSEPTLLLRDVAAEASSSLTGRVYDVETGRGIAGFRVSVENGGSWLSATTDEAGLYEVHDILAGRREVEVSRQSHPARAYLPPVPRRISLTLEPGLSYENNDFAARRGFSLNGRVVDESGRAVPAASVHVTAQGSRHRFEREETGTDGRFALTGLPAWTPFRVDARIGDLRSRRTEEIRLHSATSHGDIILVVERTGGIAGRVVDRSGYPAPRASLRVTSSEPGWTMGAICDEGGSFEVKSRLFRDVYSLSVKLPGEENFGEPLAQVAVVPGQTSQVTLRTETVCQPADLAISGRVTNLQNEPLDNVGIRLALDGLHAATRTNADGFYAVKALVAGVYQMEIDGLRRREYVAAGSTDANFVVAPLLPGTLSGNVVQADTGSPVTDFEVDFGGSPSSTMPTQVNDPFGRFEVEVRRPRGTLIVRAFGFAPSAKDFDLTTSKACQGLAFRLRPGGRINGRVVDARGEPVVAAHILLGEVPHRPGDRARDAVALTDQNGTFALESMSPGMYTLSACHPHFPLAVSEVEVVAGETREVSLAFTESGVVIGRVFLEGEPLSAVRVSEFSASQSLAEAVTQRDGNYELPGMPEGRRTVFTLVTDQGPHAGLLAPYGVWKMTQTKRVDVSAGTPAEVDFDFPLGDAGIEGVVTRDGKSVAGASVHLAVCPVAEGSWYSARADANGCYWMRGVPAGKLRINASTPDGWRSDEGLTVETHAGGSVRYDIDLRIRPQSTVSRRAR